MIITRTKVNRIFWKSLQVSHGILACAFAVFGFIEFVSNPPFFDGYGDAKISQKQLPKNLFQNDPRISEKSHLLRYMDLPIFVMLLGYFTVCCWLKFRGLSWILTFSMVLNLVFFFIVNFWASEVFTWKYYSSRNNGLELQVFTFSVSITLILMVVFYKRRKMPFKLKSSLAIQPFGKVHLAWNFIVIFIVSFTSLLLWFSKLYISWSCFETQREIMQLCEKTNMVQCHFCEECNFDYFAKCVALDNHQSFHCQSPRNLTKQKAFCIFNYNVSTYTFLTVFGYVGGLCVFVGTFSQILIHYAIRGLLLTWAFLVNLYRRLFASNVFGPMNEITINYTDAAVNSSSTELHHAATDHERQLHFRERQYDDNDHDDDLGNILINASIG